MQCNGLPAEQMYPTIGVAAWKAVARGTLVGFLPDIANQVQPREPPRTASQGAARKVAEHYGLRSRAAGRRAPPLNQEIARGLPRSGICLEDRHASQARARPEKTARAVSTEVAREGADVLSWGSGWRVVSRTGQRSAGGSQRATSQCNFLGGRAHRACGRPAGRRALQNKEWFGLPSVIIGRSWTPHAGSQGVVRKAVGRRQERNGPEGRSAPRARDRL